MLTQNLFNLVFKVTTKGAGLNPNAKVWQEVSAPTTQAPEVATETCHWPQADIVSTEESEGTYLDCHLFSAVIKCGKIDFMLKMFNIYIMSFKTHMH